MQQDSYSPKIPVLLLVRELGIGGSERQMVETALFLPRERFIPHVGCFRPNGLRRAELDAANIPVLHLPVHSFRSPAAVRGARQLASYIREHKIEVVHSFDAPLNVFAVPVARMSAARAVISSQRGHRDLTGATFKQLLRVTDRMADAVVVNCAAMKQYLVDEERVPANKVKLCYNALERERYRRRPTESRFPGRVVIGTVAVLRREKALDVLLAAFAEVRKLGAGLVVVGSGPEEQHLRALASKLGITAACHFEPATASVVEWLSGIDIFVLPSRSEALSNSLMEAMACGCCPVASRVGGNPELVEDGQSGLLFEVDNVAELASKLSALVLDANLRRMLASAASAKVDEFTPEAAARRMQAIYEAVLDAKRSLSSRSAAHSA